MMGSTPATFAKKPAKKTIAITKIYCETLSPCIFLKNQRAINGKPNNTIAAKSENEIVKRTQNSWFNAPVVEAEITASTNNAKIGNLVYFAPFLSLVFIRFILKEEIFATTFIGLIFIVAGVLVQQMGKKKEIS